MFDLAIVKPDMLYEEVIEVDGRIIPKRDDCHFKADWKVVKGRVIVLPGHKFTKIIIIAR